MWAGKLSVQFLSLAFARTDVIIWPYLNPSETADMTEN